MEAPVAPMYRAAFSGRDAWMSPQSRRSGPSPCRPGSGALAAQRVCQFKRCNQNANLIAETRALNTARADDARIHIPRAVRTHCSISARFSGTASPHWASSDASLRVIPSASAKEHAASAQSTSTVIPKVGLGASRRTAVRQKFSANVGIGSYPPDTAK